MYWSIMVLKFSWYDIFSFILNHISASPWLCMFKDGYFFFVIHNCWNSTTTGLDRSKIEEPNSSRKCGQRASNGRATQRARVRSAPWLADAFGLCPDWLWMAGALPPPLLPPFATWIGFLKELLLKSKVLPDVFAQISWNSSFCYNFLCDEDPARMKAVLQGSCQRYVLSNSSVIWVGWTGYWARAERQRYE